MSRTAFSGAAYLGKVINAAPTGRAQPFSDQLSTEFGDRPDQYLVPAGGQVIIIAGWPRIRGRADPHQKPVETQGAASRGSKRLQI